MAHRVSAPALQRAQRLLQQWVRPQVTSPCASFSVRASAELFEPISFDEVRSLDLVPFAVGSAWGKPWHTVWFLMEADVPSHADGLDLVASIDLGFSGRGDGFQVEGMAWIDGRRVQAVQPDRRLVPLGKRRAGEHIELWVEAAATPIIAGHAFGYGPTLLGDPSTSGDGHLYTLKKAELGLHHRRTEELAGLLHSIIDLVIDSEENSPQRARLFDLLDKVADVVDVRSIDRTASDAVDLIRSEAARWSSPTRHSVTAVGHAHLDTAWLWPIRETRRKAVRTFANAVRLLDENPDAVFCHSQAQHYQWVLEEAPEIFERVRSLVREGRWEPVGGMWVETDLNLPSGESLIRQFVRGRRAFSSWFGEDGIRSAGAFLPDDFGYPGTLPQIIRHCAGEWFFSQKLSWNETNRFPHHSFWWEGIDGSRVFAHFSPVETYNALLTPSQLRFAERNFADHVGASTSLALYGHGDGGGGPTQQMIDRVRDSHLWSDVPVVGFGTVAGFFRDAVAEYGSRAPIWVGEMYLEKHRGTYSSQVETKAGNRRCERLLHEWELWASALGGDSPADVSERADAWQRVLTQQFHDIIPGSSIAWVHDDAEREHRSVAEAVNARIDRLLGVRTSESLSDSEGSCVAVANPAPVAVRGVESIAGAHRWIDVPEMSIAPLDVRASRPADVQPVEIEDRDGGVAISNGLISLHVDEKGSITDIVNVASNRSIVSADRTVVLRALRDMPAEYDAWDIDKADADTRGVDLESRGGAEIVSEDDLGATLKLDLSYGNSVFALFVTIRAGEPIVRFRLEAEWSERETRLQFVAPLVVFARDAICGAQFGHVRRPRHANTSWDAAKFEVCAHRYVYVSEPGCGAALMADGPRGYDVRGSELRMTVLRSPSFPDPHCDEGRRVVEWGLYVDDGPGDVAELERHAARRAHPIRLIHGEISSSRPPVLVEIPGVLVSVVKPAEDGSGDTVVRLWETRGANCRGAVHLGREARVSRVDGHEEMIGPVRTRTAGEGGVRFDLEMRPFEIVSLRLSAIR